MSRHVLHEETFNSSSNEDLTPYWTAWVISKIKYHDIVLPKYRLAITPCFKPEILPNWRSAQASLNEIPPLIFALSQSLFKTWLICV